jgi:hypothetical protein
VVSQKDSFKHSIGFAQNDLDVNFIVKKKSSTPLGKSMGERVAPPGRRRARLWLSPERANRLRQLYQNADREIREEAPFPHYENETRKKKEKEMKR